MFHILYSRLPAGCVAAFEEHVAGFMYGGNTFGALQLVASHNHSRVGALVPGSSLQQVLHLCFGVATVLLHVPVVQVRVGCVW
jgi:hypothetical protein